MSKTPFTRIAASTAARALMAEAKASGRILSYTQALASLAEKNGYANVHELTASYVADAQATPSAAWTDEFLALSPRKFIETADRAARRAMLPQDPRLMRDFIYILPHFVGTMDDGKRIVETIEDILANGIPGPWGDLLGWVSVAAARRVLEIERTKNIIMSPKPGEVAAALFDICEEGGIAFVASAVPGQKAIGLIDRAFNAVGRRHQKLRLKLDHGPLNADQIRAQLEDKTQTVVVEGFDRAPRDVQEQLVNDLRLQQIAGVKLKNWYSVFVVLDDHASLAGLHAVDTMRGAKLAILTDHEESTMAVSPKDDLSATAHLAAQKLEQSFFEDRVSLYPSDILSNEKLFVVELNNGDGKRWTETGLPASLPLNRAKLIPMFKDAFDAQQHCKNVTGTAEHKIKVFAVDIRGIPAGSFSMFRGLGDDGWSGAFGQHVYSIADIPAVRITRYKL